MQDHSMTASLEGKVLVSEHGDVRVHTYISPEDGLLTNTQIVEGPNRLVIFDGQFFLPYAREVARYMATLGKPVDRIVLSHIHLDHWSGLSVLTEHYPDAPVCSVPAIADYLRSNGQRILDARRSAFGDKIPARPVIPTRILPEGEVTLDGVRIEFTRFIDAESALQLVALMPDLQTLLAFDLIFAPNEHVFTVTSHFENWITVLEGLNRLSGYNRILSGHGEPTDRSAINATIAYLREGRHVHASTTDPAEYASRMKAIFHDRQHPEWIDLSASLLYSVVDAYDATDSRRSVGA
jgi:glyoxylase-like metal-dependent hydrolase (beta-lactamase superfamily II)